MSERKVLTLPEFLNRCLISVKCFLVFIRLLISQPQQVLYGGPFAQNFLTRMREGRFARHHSCRLPTREERENLKFHYRPPSKSIMVLLTPYACWKIHAVVPVASNVSTTLRPCAPRLAPPLRISVAVPSVTP